MSRRLTMDKTEDMYVALHNIAYIANREVWLREMGENGTDISLADYAKAYCKQRCGNDFDDVPVEELSECICGCVSDGVGECLMPWFYSIAIGAAGLRTKLKRYEDVEERGALVSFLLSPEDNYDGLKRKYVVFKADSGEAVENCFVLRPDKDPVAKFALEAYAKATDNKVLAKDIHEWIGDNPQQPMTLREVHNHLFKMEPNEVKPLYVVFNPPIPAKHAPRWRDAYSLSMLMEDGSNYGKTWLAYREAPPAGSTPPFRETAEEALRGADDDKR